MSGFYGDRCDRECASGRFGVNCNSSCDCNLQNSAKCDPKTGLCLCVPGFKGIRCDEVSIVLLTAIFGLIEPEKE